MSESLFFGDLQRMSVRCHLLYAAGDALIVCRPNEWNWDLPIGDRVNMVVFCDELGSMTLTDLPCVFVGTLATDAVRLGRGDFAYVVDDVNSLAQLRFPDFEVTDMGPLFDNNGEVTRLVNFRRMHPELQYLSLVSRALSFGEVRQDGTLSLFAEEMRFPLGNGFPLFTTKRVFWKGVVEELLWMVRGSTSAKELSAKGVKIWDANASKESLAARGLDYPEGELGPVYGKQWRDFGGVDQLALVVEQLKRSPQSRRIVMSAWNPPDIPKMALPSCHIVAQFRVDSLHRLSCKIVMRSCDLACGAPFNVASYALLTNMLAHICGLGLGELVVSIGDAHIYPGHVNGMLEQTCRDPRKFPELKIKRLISCIDDFKADDFELLGYEPYPSIRFDMVNTSL